VTIVAPKTRIDLALPSNVPFADLLPTVLRFAGGNLANDPVAANGWSLSKAGEPPLDPDTSPVQADVRDGDVLYLRPRGAEFPEPIFDDVVDAVATATQDRSGRWRQTTTRGFGLAVGVATLVAGAVMVSLAGPPQLPAALVGLATAAVLLAVATVLSRAFSDSGTGSVFGIVALGYLGIGGLLLLAGDRPLTELAAPHVLVAGVAILLGSAVAMVGVADRVAVFLAAFFVAIGICLAALTCVVFGASPAAGAVGVATVAFGVMPLLPMLSFRLTGLPVPSIPTGPDDLRADTETVDGSRVLALSERADQVLGGLLGAVAVLGGTAGVVAAATGELSGALFALVIGLFMLARARWFVSKRQRLPLLLSGLLTTAVVAFGGFLSASQMVRLSAGLGCMLLAAGASIGFALSSDGRRRAPVWGRTLDLVEMVLVLAIVPLAVWVSGLYGWVRAIRDM
jgi:type VII secretion integral membrane protein EccD